MLPPQLQPQQLQHLEVTGGQGGAGADPSPCAGGHFGSVLEASWVPSSLQAAE